MRYWQATCLLRILAVLLIAWLPAASLAQRPQGAVEVATTGATDDSTREWIVEKTGEFLPLSVRFTNEHGQEVSLGELIDRPTLLLPIYFFCPSSCSRNLANMAVAMNQMSFEPGQDYKAIALSFSDTETAENSVRAKRNYLKLTYDGFPEEAWTFLTGSREAIKTVTDAVGFRFKRMEDGTFLHPSTVIAIGSDGKIVRYVYGSFVKGDMDMAVVAARDGTPALSVKRFLEFCLSYDPDRNKPIFTYVKIGVVAFFMIVVAAIFLLSRKKGRKSRGTL